MVRDWLQEQTHVVRDWLRSQCDVGPCQHGPWSEEVGHESYIHVAHKVPYKNHEPHE